jgi:UDP-glucose 4-epimerase
MARTLVVGCGFIGSHLVTELAALGTPPAVLTRSRPRAPEVAAAIEEGDLHLGDAADQGLLATALEGVEQVAYCAGGLLPAAAERDPERDRELTLGPLRAVLRALRERPGVRFAYVSSGGTVYGNPVRLPAREDDPAVPISAYGEVHLACEREIEAERSGHGLRSRILRCSTVYGEHQQPDRGQGAIVTFLSRIRRGAEIQLYGDGATIRDYVYAGDVARAMIALLESDDRTPLVNVGAGAGTSVIDVLRMAESEVGQEARIERRGERGFEVHQIVLDTSLLHELVGLEITPLEEGIRRTHRWLAATAAEAR